MGQVVLKRQFITDAAGNPVAVILPLEQQFPATNDEDKLERMRSAAQDPDFLADLTETMSAFAAIDAEWWEPARGPRLCQRGSPR